VSEEESEDALGQARLKQKVLAPSLGYRRVMHLVFEWEYPDHAPWTHHHIESNLDDLYWFLMCPDLLCDAFIGHAWESNPARGLTSPPAWGVSC
jgi:hypothetical protein